MLGKVGFTTSIPIEVLLAAGRVPVDLNNIFINTAKAADMTLAAEEAGFPRTTCGWIKGLYTSALQENLEAVIAVMQGDCSNTLALMETLQLQGVKMIPFAFPFDRDPLMLEAYINKLMDYFGISMSEVLRARESLNEVRHLCKQIDKLTWQDNLVSGGENHYYLVSSSDFNQNPQQFFLEAHAFINEARQREPLNDEVRLAYIGVPPIFTDLYPVLESMGARVVYNEVQRQFSMPFDSKDLVDQYIQYTYPYGAFARLEDIMEQIARRNVDGIIHYTQTFCFRQIEDMIFRQKLQQPFLTLEGDQPGKVDARSKMRLEAFITMLKATRKSR